MKPLKIFFLFLSISGWGMAWGGDSQSLSNPWESVKTPAPGKTEAFGGASAGCYRGAIRLNSAENKGFRIMRPSRKRVYGQPDLIALIEGLGKQNLQSRRVVLLGDLGLPRGGPMRSGHHSHQTGLDVDVWFWTVTAKEASRWKTPGSREKVGPPPVLKILKKSQASIVANLKFAAEYEKTDRIFVTPPVKKMLCDQYGNESWIHKIRPWWGHDHHFHVRLKCPIDQPHCAPSGDPLPAGSGCDETLAWWFSDEARQKEKEMTLPTVPERVKLPEQCQALIEGL